MSKKKILIIDDEDNLRITYRMILERFKQIEVYDAADGDTGLQMARMLRPDLVILDNKMPGTPGEQIAKLLRASSETRNMPIIMTTGMRLSNNEIELIKLDVNELLLKPVDPVDLIREIEQYLGVMT